MKERKSAGNGQAGIEGGVHVESIRKAAPGDASRLAEILIFAKRAAYRPIFRNDAVSFGEMQVLPLALDYLEGRKSLSRIWVYDGGFVKGMVLVDSGEIHELYVDPFFQNEGIGGLLLDFAVRRQGGRTLWVLEKNRNALAFYRAHGFQPTGERRLEEGTPEYVLRLALGSGVAP